MKGRSRRLSDALARLLVRLAALTVPSSYRDRFRGEWLSELWHESEGGAPRTKVLGRALGAFADALATRSLPLPEPGVRRNRILSLLDLRLALRALAKRPLSTSFVVLTIAFAIGANTAVFALVHAVLLQPLRYDDADELVKIEGLRVDTGERANLSPADFYDFAFESETIAAMGALGWIDSFTVTGEEEPERVPGSRVTAGLLSTLGVEPLLGRLFTEDDDRPGSTPAVLLTHAFWQSRFGGRSDVLGSTIGLNAEPAVVVGVLPRNYLHPEPSPDREPLLYTLYRFDRADLARSGRFIRAVGRLRQGRSAGEADAELRSLAGRLERIYPETNTARGVRVTPLKEAIVADSRTGLLALYGAVGALLLVACLNLANLQLARGAERHRGLAIQSALGAGRGRLVRQLLSESALMTISGGALGLLVARAARDTLARAAIPRAVELELDPTVVGFCLLLSVATGILFGLAPALHLSSESAARALSEGGVRGSSSRASHRRLLVAVEVSLCLPLLVAAGLFLKSLMTLRSVTPGFAPDRVLALSLSLPLARYPEGEQIPFYAGLEERIRALPGVVAAGDTNILPMTDNYSSDGFQIDEHPVPEGEKPSAEARSVSPGYFEAMGIPLLKGRLFDGRDREASPGVVIVSEAMARTFWAGEDPLGKRITYNRGVPEEGRAEVGGVGSREIVGIVGDVKHFGLGEVDVPTFYTPHTHQPSFHTRTLVVSATSPPEGPEGIVRAISRELAALDPEVPLYSVRRLSDVLDGSIDSERFRTRLVGAFALVALGLAGIGVYGVMGLAVVEREREIGIRMALGARVGDIVRMLVGESMRPVLWGLGAGCVLALLLTRLIASLLFRLQPGDPLTYVEVSALLSAVAFAAALLPTLRAAGVDPVKTLRE